jgi:hypothetical protein
VEAIHSDEDRHLRRAGITGAIGFAVAAAWGFYIFVGIAISGYTLGRNGITDLLAVAPPLAAGGLLVYGAVVALRDIRRDDWLVRLIAVVLFLIEAALGVSLFAYATWAAGRLVVAYTS